MLALGGTLLDWSERDRVRHLADGVATIRVLIEQVRTNDSDNTILSTRR
jgi:hypothetical protein